MSYKNLHPTPFVRVCTLRNHRNIASHVVQGSRYHRWIEKVPGKVVSNSLRSKENLICCSTQRQAGTQGLPPFEYIPAETRRSSGGEICLPKASSVSREYLLPRLK